MELYRYRRWFQTFFLVLFFALLTLTVWPLGQISLGAFLLADPLIALNSLAGGVAKWEMLAALVVVLLALGLSRAFCGYVCPLGFILELTGPRKQRVDKLASREFFLKLTVFIVTICLSLVVFGSAIYLVFDPLSLLTRSSTVGLYPLLDRAARLVGDALYLISPLRGFVDTVTALISGRIIFSRTLAYQLQLLIVTMFLVILGVSVWQRRLWCRHLCPLGALLGQLGRVAPFGRVVDESKCIRCRKCEAVCPMDAIREEGTATDKTRCQLGFECADTCPEDAISFGARPRSSVVDPSRRAFLGVTATALVAGFFINTSFARQEKAYGLVRPPGARDETDFLALCCRCGQCMKVCPTNVLQPSLWAAGTEGIFTPQLIFDHGFCDWSCNECGKICPTGAIGALALERKRRTVIGRAYIDRDRCIPWADYKNCLVCEELCPTPDKAILFTEETVKDPSGRDVALKRPEVIADRCIGCGICEFNCPVGYQAAIVVRATRRIPGSVLRGTQGR